jgi:hypothetical protein
MRVRVFLSLQTVPSISIEIQDVQGKIEKIKKKNLKFPHDSIVIKKNGPFLRSSHQLMDSHGGHTFCSLGYI